MAANRDVQSFTVVADMRHDYRLLPYIVLPDGDGLLWDARLVVTLEPDRNAEQLSMRCAVWGCICGWGVVVTPESSERVAAAVRA